MKKKKVKKEKKREPMQVRNYREKRTEQKAFNI